MKKALIFIGLAVVTFLVVSYFMKKQDATA